MLSYGRRDKQEKKTCGNLINGAKIDAGGVASENNDRVIDQANQGIARVRQCDPVTDASAVQLLPVMQGAQQGLPRFGLVCQCLDLIDQLLEDRIAVRAFEIQVN